MQSWHPVTKIAASLGLLGLVIAWWTSDTPPSENVLAAVHAESAPTEPTEAIDAPAPLSTPLVDRAIPAISAFETMVSRPLFTPDRRPVESELSLATTPVPTIEPAPTGDVPAPDIRFIGSIEDDGAIRALVSDGANVRGLELGQLVDGWEVVAIEPRRLRLGLADRNVELTILE